MSPEDVVELRTQPHGHVNHSDVQNLSSAAAVAGWVLAGPAGKRQDCADLAGDGGLAERTRWKLDDERGGARQGGVLRAHGAARVADEPRDRQAHKAGEPELNSRIPTGEVDQILRLVKPDADPGPRTQDQRARRP